MFSLVIFIATQSVVEVYIMFMRLAFIWLALHVCNAMSFLVFSALSQEEQDDAQLGMEGILQMVSTVI